MLRVVDGGGEAEQELRPTRDPRADAVVEPHRDEGAMQELLRSAGSPRVDPLGALAARAAHGDEGAMQVLLRSIASSLLAAVRAVVGRNAPDVEDIAQETMVAFVQALPAFRGECSVNHYVSRIAVRTAVAARKRRLVRENRAESLENEAMAEQYAASPGEEAWATRRRTALRSLLDELPDIQAETFALRIALGYSMLEVAEATGAPVNTVRSRLRLAKEALRRRIEADPALAEVLGGQMNQPVDVHPEDLLELEQHGELTREERARLEAHVTICAACALVRRASLDFEVERLSVQGDEALIGRITANAMASAPSAAPPASPRRSSYIAAYPRRRRRSWAIAGALLFAATGATASFWSVRHGLVSRLLVKAPYSAPAARPETKEPPAPRSPSPPRSEIAVVEPPPPAPAKPVAPPPPSPARSHVEEVAPVSADQLFASANEARRRGDSAQAVKLYRQLQQQFPGTRQEATSRVLLGRLLQDRGEDPAQSLALFTRYLAESSNGTLAEEARLGRALALMRLGRTQDERLAWQDLLSSHPTSIHAERARKRLDELR